MALSDEKSHNNSYELINVKGDLAPIERWLFALAFENSKLEDKELNTIISEIPITSDNKLQKISDAEADYNKECAKSLLGWVIIESSPERFTNVIKSVTISDEYISVTFNPSFNNDLWVFIFEESLKILNSFSTISRYSKETKWWEAMPKF